MKHLIILLLITTTAKAQVDSTTLIVQEFGLSLRNWAYVTSLFPVSDELEDIKYTVTRKARVGTVNLNTRVTADSVSIATLFLIHTIVHNDRYRWAVNDVDSSLTALNIPFISNYVRNVRQAENAVVQERIQTGVRRLQGIRKPASLVIPRRR